MELGDRIKFILMVALAVAVLGLTILLSAWLVTGCAPAPAPSPVTPAPAPTLALKAAGTNPTAWLGLGAAAGIDILALANQGPGGQPSYVPRLTISDTAAIAALVGTLNADLETLPKALCVPAYELRFRLPGGATKKVMYSCEGASFLRSDEPSWGAADLRPPAAFDKLINDLLSSKPTVPPGAAVAVPEQAELARDVALVFMSREQPGKAPAAGLAWQPKRMTPQNILGYETWQFSSGDWVVAIGYPVTRLDQTVYRATVTNKATGAKWERELSAADVPLRYPVPNGG